MEYKTNLHFEEIEGEEFDTLNVRRGAERIILPPSGGWSLIRHSCFSEEAKSRKRLEVNIKLSDYFNYMSQPPLKRSRHSARRWAEEYGYIIAHLDRLGRPYKINFI